MTLIVLHTGQTGVERGADRAARAEKLRVEGFSTYERRDELGALPVEIARDLLPTKQRGSRSALRATLELANVLVIVVPELAKANSNTGIEALRRSARARGVPQWIIDPTIELDHVVAQLCALQTTTDPLRVMVTGPRFTRWQAGERLGWRLIAQMAMTVGLDIHTTRCSERSDSVRGTDPTSVCQDAATSSERSSSPIET